MLYIYGNRDDYDVNNDNNTSNDNNLSIHIIAYAIYSTSHYQFQWRYITPTREFLLDNFAYWYVQRIVYSCTIDAITLTE